MIESTSTGSTSSGGQSYHPPTHAWATQTTRALPHTAEYHSKHYLESSKHRAFALAISQVVTLCAYAQHAGLCVWSRRFVYMCIYMWPKNWLFEVLPLENLSLV